MRGICTSVMTSWYSVTAVSRSSASTPSAASSDLELQMLEDAAHDVAHRSVVVDHQRAHLGGHGGEPSKDGTRGISYRFSTA